MQINKLLEIIDNILPAGSAADGDRIGLQIHAGREKARTVLVTYELTEDVINEAIKLKCDCIISFHPLIYLPMLRIHSTERVGRLSIELIKHSISLIVVHTNFDAFAKGTSSILAEKLGLEVARFLIPDRNISNCGMGVVAKTAKPIIPGDFVEQVSSVCGSPVRFCKGTGRNIENVAIVGGSGSSFLQEALDSSCDVFITADISYHKFHQVNNLMMLIDPGHYEMEQFVANELAGLIVSLDTGHELESVYVSGIYTNPVSYFPETYKYRQKQMNYLINNNLTV